MSEVTIQKEEYQALKRESVAYRKIASKLFASVVKDDVAFVIRDFAKTGKYSKDFLKDMETGLRKSSSARS